MIALTCSSFHSPPKLPDTRIHHLIVGYRIRVGSRDSSQAAGEGDKHFVKLSKKLVPLGPGRLEDEARRG